MFFLALFATLIGQSFAYCDLNGHTLKCDGESLENVVSQYGSVKDTIEELVVVCADAPLAELRRRDVPFASLKRLRLSHGVEELSDEVFTRLRQLKELSLAGNKIARMPDEPLAELSLLDALDISRNVITKLDAGIRLKALTKLNLSGNRIAVAKRAAFGGFEELVDLDLNGNNIVVLEEDVFADLVKLRIVDLGGNKLRTVPAALFDGNPLLRNLVLAQNRFRADIPDGFLSKNKQLVYLDFRGTYMRMGDFIRNVTSLKHLNLDATRMTDMRVNIFDQLHDIERIQLSQCHLYKIKLFFRHTALLNYLDLSYNQLEYLPENLFENAYGLAFLNLTNNRLRKLPFNIFATTVLKTVDLSHNYLRSIDWYELDIPTLENLHLQGNSIYNLKTSFNGSLSLKYLDLSDNSLFFINGDFFAKLRKLAWMEFMKNPYNCKCLDELRAEISVRKIGSSKNHYNDGTKPVCVVYDFDCVRNVSYYNVSSFSLVLPRFN